MLSPTEGTPTGLLTDCPVCRRTIWAGGACPSCTKRAAEFVPVHPVKVDPPVRDVARRLLGER